MYLQTVMQDPLSPDSKDVIDLRLIAYPIEFL